MTPSSTQVVSPRTEPTQPEQFTADWAKTVDKYKRSSPLKSVWQVVNTSLPLAGLWYLMYLASFWSTALTLLLAIPTAGFLVRIFIIQHDCGHRSFFRNQTANDVLGFLCGILTLTPYFFWRRTHARHHTTNGNLSHRGHGDVLTWTVDEYRSKSPWGRWAYRVYRSPLFLFIFGSTYLFFIRQRFTFGMPASWRRERMSVHATNLGIAVMLAAGWYLIGLPALLLIWLPVAMLGAAAGSWLFFVQHQIEDAYWQPQQSWDFTRAALEGSSYYRLPAVLQWFTGNIGFHHIHHLNSRIPNYHLSACHAAEAAFREGPTFGFWESLRCASLKLWDEESQRMVGFAAVDV